MNKQLMKTAAAAAIGLALTACGGGSGDGGNATNGTRTVTTGPIEGFGSVIVNGVKFETGSNDVLIEGDNGDTTASQAALQIGMVVTINGTVNDDGVTGQADVIRYDDDVEGPIAGPITEDTVLGTKTFSVLGVTVVVSATDTVFDDSDNYGYADLADGDVIEVSGLFGEQGRLMATYVERKQEQFQAGSTLVEVKGVISNLDTVAMTFDIGTLNVDYSGAMLDDDISALEEGMFVEVKGTLDGNLLTATKVEAEGMDDTDDDEKAEIQGLIADFDGVAQTFTINGQAVSFAGVVRYEPVSLEGNLADGLRVEVEGPVVEAVLQAREIKIRGGQIEVEAPVHSVDGDSITLRLIPGDASSDVTVLTDTGTRFEDGLGSIADVAVGQFLEVKARPDVDDATLLLATRVKLEEEADDHSLEGPLGSMDETSITLLDVTYSIDASTEFEGLNDEPMTLQQFLAAVSPGTLVEVEDENDAEDGEVADGIADEVSLED